MAKEEFKKQPPQELKEIKEMRAQRIAKEKDWMQEQAIAETEAGMRELGVTGEDVDAQREAVRKQRLRKPDMEI